MGRLTGEPQATRVKTISLDEFARKDGALPNFLKIDVEGAELLVLNGAKELLAKHHPTIFLAIHSHEMNHECAALLGHLGYRITILFKDPENGIYELLCE